MWYRIISLFLVIGFLGCNSENNNTNYIEKESSPATNLFLGDPFILLDGDTYYAYGTGQGSDTGIEVYRSDNLKEWEGPIGDQNGFALHEDDVQGDRWFWAPEVYKIDGRYYMFYSVEEHMAIAESESPVGPFIQQEPSVLADFKAIDHNLLIEDDGTTYLYFAKFEDGLEIWGAEMADDFSHLKEETLTQLLTQSQDWEKSPKEPVGIVNEGPYVVKKDGRYYMTYSANHYASPDYGIGLAYADSPLGNWAKSEQNPVIQNPDTLKGTGHSSFFTDKEGSLNIVYHAHFDSTEVHPRKVFFNKVRFAEAGKEKRYSLEVLSPIYEPIVVPSTE